MTEKRFKNALIEFDKAKHDLKYAKMIFQNDVIIFMRKKGIPVRVLFFGDTFGLDIMRNWYDVPRKIPLDVLTDFCNEFGCEYEYTNYDGKRWIFSFDKLNMGFNR